MLKAHVAAIRSAQQDKLVAQPRGDEHSAPVWVVSVVAPPPAEGPRFVVPAPTGRISAAQAPLVAPTSPAQPVSFVVLPPMGANSAVAPAKLAVAMHPALPGSSAALGLPRPSVRPVRRLVAEARRAGKIRLV
jgi:hypothetical protein